MERISLLLIIILISLSQLSGQYSRQDSLRGSITPERAWWDLTHYHLHVDVHPEDSTLQGKNIISYKVLASQEILQVDLQEPLKITEVKQNGKSLDFITKGAAHFVHLKDPQEIGSHQAIEVHYAGRPHIAIRAPWDGGISWKYDNNKQPFVASSCQGIGASIWWPCKDHMADEPDSMDISVTTPGHLMDVSNGQLVSQEELPNGRKTFHWTVKNPINNYGVNLSVGDYVHFNEVYQGENGPLKMDYFVLRDNLEKAKKQFLQVPTMMASFEHWFGPYPFYEDGFKLVEVPYLGMEHQSAVTYGNGYMNGYRGSDLSGSGWGLKFDFIIIHEAGHEWFANNITYKDIADMWIHESFTAYSESLFVESEYGKEAGADYVIGTRMNINNDKPIIGVYGVNQRGSGDMYYKGSNMLHTLRQIVNDDEKWRMMLRGLNEEFYHKTVTSKQIEKYMSRFLEIDLGSFFDQYLRTTQIPTLQYVVRDGNLRYRWMNVVEGFEMPVKLWFDNEKAVVIKGGTSWRRIPLPQEGNISVDRNYYVSAFNLLGQ